MAFTLEMFPHIYKSKFNGQTWDETFVEKEHKSYEEEKAMEESEKEALLLGRNNFSDLPLVNYTTQYGMGCFEGLKAFPQKNGGIKLFRPDENVKRMKKSMEGLMMPPVEEDRLLQGILKMVKLNADSGFAIPYDAAWEKDDYLSGHALYVRPFSYAEPGIGVNLSYFPWVIVVATPVGSYFEVGGTNDAVTTDMVRATKNGTGWIKCDSNYVIPTLAKKKAIADGFMEAIFLDAEEHRYIEEGSSCNFFCLMKDGTLVTPELGDTILPGITRKSILQLAQDRGIKTEERKLSVEEVFADGAECFVSGTAAGLTPINSLTHLGQKKVFSESGTGKVSEALLVELKGIQYGAIEDRYDWMWSV
ncbi:MAG: branched-chain-amino-acid transaminase [Spirochaetales bacterium]|nr:branched-chain-amino-acid transaminase [Spirochaetales bacterium]